MIFYKKSKVYIIITDNKLICSIVNNSELTELTCCAYSKYNLDQNIIYNGTIFNLTFIYNLIEEFLVINKIKNSEVIISLDSSYIYEELTETNKTNFTDLDNYFINTQEIQFYPKTYFYTAAIRQDFLLQYKLLAIKLKLNLLGLTTSFMSLYCFYKVNCSRTPIILDNIAINNLKIFFKNLSNKKINKKIKFFKKNWPNDIDSDSLLMILGLYYLGSLINEST